jgi:hypothetical protein
MFHYQQNGQTWYYQYSTERAYMKNLKEGWYSKLWIIIKAEKANIVFQKKF